MGTKYITNPVTWRIFDPAQENTDTGDFAESVIDFREGKPYIRLMNGVKPGGRIISEGRVGKVLTPEIISPAQGAINISITPVIQSSVFVGNNKGNATTHYASVWELATDIDFKYILYSSGADTVNLLSIDLLSIGLVLNGDTVYYARVRYVANTADASDWSVPVSFRTIRAIPSVLTNTFTKNSPTSGDYFGRAVAISGDGNTVAVGGYGGLGVVYVYTNDNGVWSNSSMIQPVGIVDGSYFGYSIALSRNGTRLAIGAPLVDSSAIGDGVVYIYDLELGSWVEKQVISVSGMLNYDYFGVGVYLGNSGNTLVIGAGWKDTATEVDVGRAYVYDYVNNVFTQVAILSAPDGAAGYRFGDEVSIDDSGSTIVVSSHLDNSLEFNAGSAYVFEHNGNNWVYLQKLTAIDYSSYSTFGIGVNISRDGSTIAIGANYADSSALDSGGVYIFRKINGTWMQIQKLTASDNSYYFEFGTNVALSEDGSLLFVGSQSADGSGAVYVFMETQSGWIEQSKISLVGNSSGYMLGRVVACSDNGAKVIAGAPGNSTYGANSGSAHLFG
jgi:hypothetical protein